MSDSTPPPVAPGAATRIAAAIETIGPSDRDDYVIAPLTHAERYRETPLARLLAGSAAQVAAEHFEKHDALALEHQARFEATARRARTAVFLAGTATAVLLAAGGLSNLFPGVTLKAILVIAGAATILAGALAAMWIRRIKEGHLLERWMTERAKAETRRLDYFERIAGETCDEPLLQLEYFRRYQLDVQRTYYRRRGDDHRRAADRALDRSSLGMAVGAAASGLAGVLAVVHLGWTALAGLGLVGQAWASRIANAEATEQNQRNAERYGRTGEVLDRLHERLPGVREAVAQGDRQMLEQFLEAVHEQLSLEHRQWLEELEAASQAIARLEGMLARYREVREGGGSPTPD